MMRLQACRAVMACESESVHAAFSPSVHGCVKYLPSETLSKDRRDLRLPRKVKSAKTDMRSRKALPVRQALSNAQT